MIAAMSGGIVLDVLLMLAVLGAMALGWRQGAVAALLSIIGVVAGGIVGLELAPIAMDLVEGRAARLIVGVGVLIGLVIVGHMVGAVAALFQRLGQLGQLRRYLAGAAGAGASGV